MFEFGADASVHIKALSFESVPLPLWWEGMQKYEGDISLKRFSISINGVLVWSILSPPIFLSLSYKRNILNDFSIRLCYNDKIG